MSDSYETTDRIDRIEQESRRLSRKILKIEKRLSLFDKHETEKHLNDQIELARDIRNKFSLLYTKITVLESVRYYLKHDDRLFRCSNNIVKAFDEDKKFWSSIDEMTLEEVSEVFYMLYPQ